MGHLSTHVLDTMNGCPAAGMQVSLQRVEGDRATVLKTFHLNSDGRHEGGALLDAQAMASEQVPLVSLIWQKSVVALKKGWTIDPGFNAFWNMTRWVDQIHTK